jgi:ATP-dependent Clp protease ATP-binding subunit ClpA
MRLLGRRRPTRRYMNGAMPYLGAAANISRRFHHEYIGTEHVLLAIAEDGGTPARVLGERGLSAGAIQAELVNIIGLGQGPAGDLDGDALATLGIDLDAVRERVEKAFGAGALSRRDGCRSGTFGGHTPFTPRAKKALELTLREGIALGARDLRAEHLVLGLLREGDGVAAQLLHARGLALDEVRARVEGRDAA